jgi:hypothetical protein
MARCQLSHRNKGSATIGPTGARIPQQGLAAACVAVVAFLCYYATLVPGLDLGDSASFQTGLGSLTLTPRHAYPLYHGVGGLFVWLHPGEPARAANLASAVFGALAVGLAVSLAAKLADSVLAGVAAGLFLAFSYTFWSQAITAEVYTLHLLVVGASGVALLAWAEVPSVARLALFYAAVALAFGNHLSMVLLLPAFVLFLLMHRRPGPGDPLQPRLVLMAAAIAALGALQYAWNFRGLWTELEPPASIGQAVAKFWFDVTKADWRETLVMTLSESGLQSRPAMYWFDLRQQVGVPGVVLAAIGFFYVLWRWPPRAILLVLLYAANLAFAWTYNVGDAYIFFLPSHYVVALAAGAGAAAIAALVARMANRTSAAITVALLLLYPLWRGYDTFPALDRSWDTRAVQLLDAFADGSGGFSAKSDHVVLGLDANWQVQNAIEYYMRERKPELVWFTTDQFEWLLEGDPVRRFRTFVSDNAKIDRSVIVSARTAEKVMSPPPAQWLEDTIDDNSPHYLNFGRRVEQVRPGTAYIISILSPDQEYSLSTMGLAHAWRWLAPGAMMPPLQHYTVVIGRVGQRPILTESSDRPYRVGVTVEGFEFDVRMESWLPTDTIRRAGFGHVIVNRRHVLTLERGISFVALGPGGGPFYESGLFAPARQLLVRPNP